MSTIDSIHDIVKTWYHGPDSGGMSTVVARLQERDDAIAGQIYDDLTAHFGDHQSAKDEVTRILHRAFGNELDEPDLKAVREQAVRTVRAAHIAVREMGKSIDALLKAVDTEPQ